MNNLLKRTFPPPIVTAMILSAGFGSRMRPITEKTPKPLVKVNGHALIDHALGRLEMGGVERVIVNLHYLGDQIKDHLSERKKPKIIFSWEKKDPLETGGGVKRVLPKIGKTAFWVINSDSIWLNGPTNMMFRMLSAWDSSKMDALLLLHPTVDSYGYNGYGDFSVDPDGKLTRRDEREVVPWLFTGIQILHPRLFVNAPKGRFSLNILYDQAIERGRIYGVIHDGEWFHVGTKEGLDQVEEYMKLPYAGTKRR